MLKAQLLYGSLAYEQRSERSLLKTRPHEELGPNYEIMFFYITLIALVYGSIMCWLNSMKIIVLACWVIWLFGFFGMPTTTAQGWHVVGLQSLLALVLVLRWRIRDAMP